MPRPLLAVAAACLLAPSCSDVQNSPPPPGFDDRLATLQDEALETRAEGAWRVRVLRRQAAVGRRGEAMRSLAAPAEREVAELGVVDAMPTAAATPGAVAHAPAAPAAPLRAGSIDDNDDLAAFLAYLEDSRAAFGPQIHDLDVAGPRRITVVGPDGRPVPGARVRVVDADADRIVWRGTTQGDGVVPFYPGLAAETLPPALLVEVEADGVTQRENWRPADGDLRVRAEQAAQGRPEEVAVDVVFVIDTTGSMGDEIARIKESLAGVTERLQSLAREADLRYAAVLYRDVSDDYVTKAHPFTGDLAAFDQALQAVTADGGGDMAESLNQGLAVAVDSLAWRPGAAKVAFLIADAPPHMDYQGDIPYGDSLVAAVGKGIRIHAVAASGIDEVGSCVFRQVAQLTRGKFIFVEYGGDLQASAAEHGVKTPVGAGNNLDEILFAQIRDEIAGWGRS